MLPLLFTVTILLTTGLSLAVLFLAWWQAQRRVLPGTATSTADISQFAFAAEPSPPDGDRTPGVSTDVTQRRLAEEALRENMERMRLIVERAHDAFVAIDDRGVIVEWNPQAEAIFGYTRAEAIGQSLAETIIPHSHREAHQQGLAHFLATGEGPMLNRRVELSALHKDGREFPVEIAISPVPWKQSYLFNAFLRDITDRKQAEAESQRYVEQLEVLHRVNVELNQKLSIEYVLSMALDLTLRLSHADAGCIGLAEGEQVWIAQTIGNYPDGVLGSTIGMDKGMVGRALRQRQAELVADVASDPDYLPTIPKTRAEMVVPLLSQDRLVGVICLETSIPERFTPERFEFIKLLGGRVAAAIDNAQLYQTSQEQLAELRGLYEKVSALEQIKTDMIRVAAHDLRNPISIITGYLMLIHEDVQPYLSPQSQEFFETIERAVGRMEVITNDILSLQKIEQAAQDSHREQVDLREMVEKVYLDHEQQARRKSQDFRLHLAFTPLVVQGDPAQLNEAVVNLMSNAIKYTPDGGSVQVSLQQDDGAALFEVMDTGYGVPDDQQARLFQPFFRAESEETREIEGTGLGLHLVKNIVERHHGQMRFHSVYGQGSTFGFRLPLWKEG